MWDLRKTALLKTIDVGTAVEGLAWDYTGQFLAACGHGGVVVNQYVKSSKAWEEPLRKGVGAAGANDVCWGAKAGSLVVLDGEGSVSVLSA
jgi:pre-mRNA-processing factor 19